MDCDKGQGLFHSYLFFNIYTVFSKCSQVTRMERVGNSLFISEMLHNHKYSDLKFSKIITFLM